MRDTRYQKVYSPARFWQKLGPRARGISRFALEKALYLFYAVQDPNTPKWARRVMYGALGYFILPLDAIPDFAPILGYSDDITVMMAALATVSYYITPEIKARAHQKIDAWFGRTPASASVDA